jgi:transcriptional regulator with XRE-family HTH domain
MEVVTRRKGIRLDRDRLDYELSIRGKTARDLARLSGVQEETISRVRHGATIMPATLRKLTEALLSQPLIVGADLLIARPDRGEPE